MKEEEEEEEDKEQRKWPPNLSPTLLPRLETELLD